MTASYYTHSLDPVLYLSLALIVLWSFVKPAVHRCVPWFEHTVFVVSLLTALAIVGMAVWFANTELSLGCAALIDVLFAASAAAVYAALR